MSTHSKASETIILEGSDSRSVPENAMAPRKEIEQFWDDLSEEELDWIDGRLNRIYVTLVQKHGLSRDVAAGELRRFCQMRNCGASRA
jgi:hypothetical protein